VRLLISLVILMSLSCGEAQDEGLDGVCTSIAEEEWPKMFADAGQSPIACYNNPGWGAGRSMEGTFAGVGCCIFNSKSPQVTGCFDLWCMVYNECTWDYIDSVCSVGYFNEWPSSAVAEDGYCGETIRECKDLPQGGHQGQQQDANP